jgi:hypothetical protein
MVLEGQPNAPPSDVADGLHLHDATAGMIEQIAGKLACRSHDLRLIDQA